MEVIVLARLSFMLFAEIIPVHGGGAARLQVEAESAYFGHDAAHGHFRIPEHVLGSVIGEVAFTYHETAGEHGVDAVQLYGGAIARVGSMICYASPYDGLSDEAAPAVFVGDVHHDDGFPVGFYRLVFASWRVAGYFSPFDVHLGHFVLADLLVGFGGE